MRRKYFTVIMIAAITLLFSCSKKHVPETSSNSTGSSSSTANTGTTSVKPVVKKKATSVPRVIVVNDNAAKKSFDGRLYYDLEGRRYWRNYDDGKYYLFNKSMYTDKAYIPH
jgi:hypothetical protein